MENLTLRKTSKVITDCFSFTKDGATLFNLEFIDYRKTGESYVTKDGESKDKLEKFFRHLFINKSTLPENLQKLDDSKICQEFKGKSVIITTSIGDK